MATACPILFRVVDETVVRITAFNVTILLLSSLYMHSVWPLLFLCADFIIRLFFEKKYSPLNQLSLFVVKTLHLKSVMVDAGAKRLAAYFGLLFTIILIGAYYFNLENVFFAVSVVFIICTLLEIFFSYCVGCKIYYIIKMVIPKFQL